VSNEGKRSVGQEKPADKRSGGRTQEVNKPPQTGRTGKTTSKDTPPPEEKYLISPDFWDALLDSIPPWGDEIAAIMLIVFGVVSFLSLLNVSTDATLSAAWSNALTSLFGYGSVIVSGALLLLGVVILLPGNRHQVQHGVSWRWEIRFRPCSPFCICSPATSNGGRLPAPGVAAV
jgi:hypothetical protein